MFDLIVIGAGTAGLTAAIYAKRAGKSVLVIENKMHGGQIVSTSKVENYPGILAVSGIDFAQTLYKQVKELGGDIVYEKIESVDLKEKVKQVKTGKNLYETYGIIIANGATHRPLGCSGEEEFRDRGISYCATCDGALYAGKTVCVVGGGNTALEDCLYLSNICKKVYLIHRRKQFRADEHTVLKAQGRTNVEFILDAQVKEIAGTTRVEKVIIEIAGTGEKELEIQGVFVAIGLQPENQLFGDLIALDQEGYIIAGEDCKTNIPGVFVAGDTRTKQVRQLVTAAADGAVAATLCIAHINEA